MAKDKGTTAPVAEIKKTKCELTRDEFAEIAKDILVTFESECFEPNKQTLAEPKNFKADGDGKASFGWGVNDKLEIKLSNGKKVKLQVGLNLVVIGSKEAD